MIEPRIHLLRSVLAQLLDHRAFLEVVGAMLTRRRKTVSLGWTTWVGGERVRVRLEIEREVRDDG